MRFVKHLTGAAIGALLLGSGLLTSSAQAGYVVTFKEVGSDVVATGSGPLDLNGLTPSDRTTFAPALEPGAGVVVTGPVMTNTAVVNFWLMDFEAKIEFGSGLWADADSGTGDMVGLLESTFGDVVIVPDRYVSGNPLSNTSTWTNQSFDSLGMTPGTYVASWGTDQNQNFTLIVGADPVPIPEPASALLLGTTLAGLAAIRHCKRR